MKKFFCAIFSFVLVSLLCFTGCSDGWTEVQSITYHTDSDGYIYTSTFYRDISYEEITKEEYKNILENEKTSEYHIGVRYDDITQGKIPVNRKDKNINPISDILIKPIIDNRIARKFDV